MLILPLEELVNPAIATRRIAGMHSHVARFLPLVLLLLAAGLLLTACGGGSGY